MNPRTAAAIAFKVLGAYFSVNGASSFAFLLTSIDAPGRYVLSLTLSSGVLVAAGVVLWVGADGFARAFPSDPSTASADPERIARVGIGLVGLVFLVLGAVEIVQWAVQSGIDAGTIFPNLSLPGFGGILPPLVKAGAGAIVLFGAESIARGAFGARPTLGGPQPLEDQPSTTEEP